MHQLLRIGLRLFGFNFARPATRLGWCVRCSQNTLSTLGLLYLGLQAFPQTVFAHNVSADGITLYSRAPLPAAEATVCLDRAAALLARSELAVPGRREHIFLCDSPGWFRFFGPLSASAFAFSVPVTNHVFVASADCAADTARSTAPLYNRRSLSGVLAHEVTHGLIRHRLGWWRGTRLPAWVAEGYCDYVARESSFPRAVGTHLLATGGGDPAPSFLYFRDRWMVACLLDRDHLSFAQMVARADEPAAAEAETRQAIAQGFQLR